MELSIDTASEMASVALSENGRVVAEITWRCRRNHSVELLPTVERLLAQGKAAKEDLSAVFVNIGPGGYTGLRVGMSVAKGLAYRSRLPMVGVSRLEIDACPHAAFPGAIIAVHRAGRGELAWAAFRGDPWRETLAPRLSKPEELPPQIDGPTLVAGEIDDSLRDALAAVEGVTYASAAASLRRAGTLAALGYERLERGEAQDAAIVAPVYLRPPAIGPSS